MASALIPLAAYNRLREFKSYAHANRLVYGAAGYWTNDAARPTVLSAWFVSAYTAVMPRWIALLPALALVAGCVERTMTIKSDPPGALVYLNDREIGRTPVTRDFTWYGDYQVEIRKDGYESV